MLRVLVTSELVLILPLEINIFPVRYMVDASIEDVNIFLADTRLEKFA